MTTDAVHASLAHEDPVAAARLHPNDSARLQRALEVVRSTGRTIDAWRESRAGGIRAGVQLDLQVIAMPTAELYDRCDRRVDAMIAEGGVNEAAALQQRGLPESLPVMRAIGVGQIIQYLAGGSTLDQAIQAMKQATRNYAKRQRTWLRHQLR